MSKQKSKNSFPVEVVAKDIIEMLSQKLIDGVMLVSQQDGVTIKTSAGELPMIPGRDYIVLQLTERLPVDAGLSYLSLADEPMEVVATP
jgi:hypothetical protein